MQYTVSHSHFVELYGYLSNSFDRIVDLNGHILCQSVEMAIGDQYVTDIYIQLLENPNPEVVDISVMYGDTCYRNMFENILEDIRQQMPESTAVTLGQLLEEAMS